MGQGQERFEHQISIEKIGDVFATTHLMNLSKMSYLNESTVQ